jgi:hypothetical protein
MAKEQTNEVTKGFYKNDSGYLFQVKYLARRFESSEQIVVFLVDVGTSGERCMVASMGTFLSEVQRRNMRYVGLTDKTLSGFKDVLAPGLIVDRKS